MQPTIIDNTYNDYLLLSFSYHSVQNDPLVLYTKQKTRCLLLSSVWSANEPLFVLLKYTQRTRIRNAIKMNN